MEDHVHLLIDLHPTLSVSEFAQKFKANTSRFINEKGWALGKFQWQGGFGAFSVAQSGLERVRDYITQQEQHHRNQSFKNEYESLLKKYRVKYDTRYVFHDPLE
jgi:REP element-mobilizing transposase RayT